jgi:hypothetical protein
MRVWRNNAVKNECRTKFNVVKHTVEVEEKDQCRNIVVGILSNLKRKEYCRNFKIGLKDKEIERQTG